jgi:uncharacterized lipoprotein YehR (DUF1307 family)
VQVNRCIPPDRQRLGTVETMDTASFKKTSSSSRLRNLLLIAQTLILIAACTTRTQGQRSGLNRPTLGDKVREIDRVERERQLLLKPLTAKKDDSVRLAVLKQIREDFKNIQGLNNKMMANAWAHEELDYGHISDSISQIKSKASRLRSNLALPKPKDLDEKQLDLARAGVKEFRAALLLLDKSIMSFVTNPLFQTTNVVEVNLATQASGDLKVIIELSGNLQKSAATLMRKSKNSP